MSSHDETQVLADLVERKHNLLRQIFNLVERQAASIADRRVAELMPLLSAKQSLLDELNQIERKLDPFRHDDPASRQWASEEARERCATQIEENRQRLKEILEIEKICEANLVEHRERTARDLEENQRARDAIATYRQPPRRSGGQLDLSSE